MENLEEDIGLMVVGCFVGCYAAFITLMLFEIWGLILCGILFYSSVAAGAFNNSSSPPPRPNTSVFGFVHYAKRVVVRK